MNYFWLFLCFIFYSNLISQTKIKGQVIDFDNAVPIAFASVTYNNETIASDWEGKFYVLLIDEKLPIKINNKGFYEKIIYASNKTSTLTVKLVNDLNTKKKEIYSEIEVNNIIKKFPETPLIVISEVMVEMKPISIGEWQDDGLVLPGRYFDKLVKRIRSKFKAE